MPCYTDQAAFHAHELEGDPKGNNVCDECGIDIPENQEIWQELITRYHAVFCTETCNSEFMKTHTAIPSWLPSSNRADLNDE